MMSICLSCGGSTRALDHGSLATDPCDSVPAASRGGAPSTWLLTSVQATCRERQVHTRDHRTHVAPPQPTKSSDAQDRSEFGSNGRDLCPPMQRLLRDRFKAMARMAEVVSTCSTALGFARVFGEKSGSHAPWRLHQPSYSVVSSSQRGGGRPARCGSPGKKWAQMRGANDMVINGHRSASDPVYSYEQAERARLVAGHIALSRRVEWLRSVIAAHRSRAF